MSINSMQFLTKRNSVPNFFPMSSTSNASSKLFACNEQKPKTSNFNEFKNESSGKCYNFETISLQLDAFRENLENNFLMNLKADDIATNITLCPSLQKHSSALNVAEKRYQLQRLNTLKEDNSSGHSEDSQKKKKSRTRKRRSHKKRTEVGTQSLRALLKTVQQITNPKKKQEISKTLVLKPKQSCFLLESSTFEASDPYASLITNGHKQKPLSICFRDLRDDDDKPTISGQTTSLKTKKPRATRRSATKKQENFYKESTTEVPKPSTLTSQKRLSDRFRPANNIEMKLFFSSVKNLQIVRDFRKGTRKVFFDKPATKCAYHLHSKDEIAKTWSQHFSST